MGRLRRQCLVGFLAALVIFLVYRRHRPWIPADGQGPSPIALPATADASDDLPQEVPKSEFSWTTLPIRFPVAAIQPLPEGHPQKVPRIQSKAPGVSRLTLWYQADRQAAVKAAFERCWTSYRSFAWTADELAPLSGTPRNGLGGWGATLLDNLDTLWIMGMREEFEKAVATAAQINFGDTTSPNVITHEISIRLLGGLLSAYDLSEDPRLLRKAVEVGDMLYMAFDTPNRMPIIHWDLHRAARQEEQLAEEVVSASELSSFILEFTRLSQITRDPKYFDAAQQVMVKLDRQQDSTKLAGMWPVVLNARSESFDGDLYTMGAEVDSLYKTLPKIYALLGGQEPMYRRMYEKFTRTAAGHSLFRPMNFEDKDILVPGSVRVMMTQNGKPRTHLEPHVHHRACFAGGAFAMGGALFNIPIHRKIAQKLVDGCVWAHRAMPMGIMPEIYEIVPCASQKTCPWNEWHWKQEVFKWTISQPDSDPNLEVDTFIREHNLPRGFIAIPDTRYILRPETVESIFILYRITGHEDLLDIAWELFETIQNATEVENGNAGLVDVTAENTETAHNDIMESFWMAQTLKYFYLLFGSSDVLSLDSFVFNSGGHPLKIPEFVGEGFEFQ
ncbi:hypothetical protein N7462_008851 [Penicillium macrosclerotiorum]|uniref:uncharacterized protein n=1 Tax=Penicillium macrosclerotiorum TaxID=303699 RepID=UPI002547EDB1|nr:uncharacterized protein N7462_008851 [Penicillium macrosclerotiorum]KAJ5675954.1 hypothetical protein N7462_008851 [Penicillium macrosclerotiorum]